MVQMIYVGGRQGGFQLAAMPSRRRYSIPAAGAFVEDVNTGKQGVHPDDVDWFRSVNQGRDFRIVDQPAAPKPVAQQPAPQPAPAERRPIEEKAASWDMGIMEAEPLPEKAEEPQVTISITEAAQALAEEHDLDWSHIVGSGKDGNILVKDIEAELERTADG